MAVSSLTTVVPLHAFSLRALRATPDECVRGLHDQVVVFNHSWQSAIRNFERFVKKMRGVKLHG